MTKKKNAWFAMLLTCCVCLMACVAGILWIGSNGMLPASAREKKEMLPYASIASYAPFMSVGEEVSFVATYTYMGTVLNDDGTESERELYDHSFSWAVSEGTSVTVSELGLVTAVAEGKTTLTATYTGSNAGDTTVEPVKVTVSVIAPAESLTTANSVSLSAEDLSLDIGASYTLSAVVLPFTATDKTITWTTSDETVATVQDGVVTAVAEGTATITATLANSKFDACEVMVRDLDNSILDKTSLTLALGEQADITATVPGATEDTVYEWTSLNSEVASQDCDFTADEIVTFRAWNFGSTIITLTATVPAEEEGREPTVYVASAEVLVAADYFYIVGMNDDWQMYDTSEDAERAGVLFTEISPGIYQLTRTLWSTTEFQIIYSGINVNWTTLLNPYWYDEAKSTAEYVCNTVNFFEVSEIGVYTIMIDLTGSSAKVSITMVSLQVRTIDLVVEDGYEHYLVSDSETRIDIKFVPEIALYDAADLTYEVTGNRDNAVTVEYANSVFTLSLAQAGTEQYEIAITCNLLEASDSIVISVLPDDVIVPDAIAFDQEPYELDLNNGGESWELTVHATPTYEGSSENVASGVQYSMPEDQLGQIYVYPDTGLIEVYNFGTFKIYATSVVDPDLVAETTLTVYSSRFYLIGILDGTMVNDWDALPQSQRTLEGTAFADWELKPIDGSLTKYQADFTLEENDQFSIAFLGMAGDWYASINSAYFDEAASSTGYMRIERTDLWVNVTAVYTVTLDLSGTRASFTVEYKSVPTEFKPYTQSLYLERAGCAWNYFVSDEGNIYANGGYITVDGETNNQTLTFTYNFAEMPDRRPTFQFVTATEISGGVFYGSRWYGAGSTYDVQISGSAYEDGYFTNGGAGCEFWYTSCEIPSDLTVEFTVTFNQLGIITAIEMNMVTAE